MEKTTVLDNIRFFTATLEREKFYDFYGLMTALASPECGDYISVAGKLINLKKIVRRLRITVMYPRFTVDYATGYTTLEATEEMNKLVNIYPSLVSTVEKQSVAKLINALKVIGV